MTNKPESGRIQSWRMPNLRALARDLRRARLLAARRYAPGSIPRKGIIGGYWDGGSVVRAHMKEMTND